jgi:hypothetical protein
MISRYITLPDQTIPHADLFSIHKSKNIEEGERGEDHQQAEPELVMTVKVQALASRHTRLVMRITRSPPPV